MGIGADTVKFGAFGISNIRVEHFYKGVIYMRGKLVVVFLLTSFLFTINNYSAQEQDSRNIVINAMKKELNRSMEKLKMEGFESPYFISYWIKEESSITISGKYASITSESGKNSRRVFVEVRVGNYDFDNTERENGQYDFSSFGYIPMSAYTIPLDNNENSIRNTLWYLTDLKYKEALDHYLKKKGEKIFSVEKEHIDDFSKEENYVFYGEHKELNFEKEKWKDNIRDITSYLSETEGIFKPDMRVSGNKEINYYINSEGSVIIEEFTYYSVDISAEVKADDGMSIRNFRSYKSIRYEEIPDYKKLRNDVEQMVDELNNLKAADEMKPYSGPAILDPSVTGVIFHEAIGHRLEGERQKREESGQTFKDKIDEKIIPEFLTVTDDPTLSNFNGRSLFGHYKFDNEGIPAQKVVLIENGILKNYLLSRTPIKGFDKSNGHGRSGGSSYRGDPVGRMSTFIIKSDNEFAYNELKKMLIEECKKQGKSKGFILRKAEGGETYTQRGGMQGFKESLILVNTVDVNTGEEKLLRGVEIVGTPLSSINKIIASSKEYEVYNGYCGAESGIIPVSTVAPWTLSSEVELQKSSGRKSKPPILPSPVFE